MNRVLGPAVAVALVAGSGAHEQPDPGQHRAGESVQQRGEEGPIGRLEPHLRTTDLRPRRSDHNLNG
jgi:hypothetical protein